MQIATIGPDGAPHLTTLFYVVDEGGSLLDLRAVAEGRQPARDPRITCLVEDGEDYFELRGVSVSGTARVLRDPDEVRPIGRGVVTR